MSDQTINEHGELLTTTTDVGNLEYEVRQLRDIAAKQLKILQRVEAYLAHQSELDLSTQEDLWD